MTFDPDAAATADSGIYGLPANRDAHVVLVPVPWDATTSYRDGTRHGPRAILAASKQVDLFDLEWGRVYQAGIVMEDESREIHAWQTEARKLAEPIIAAGGAEGGDGLARVNALGAALNDWVDARVAQLCDAGKLVGVVGGDHSTPFGAIRAIAARHPGVGILHLDAHADLREAYEGFEWSHASIMYNVAKKIPEAGRVVQVGIRDFGEAEHALIQGSRGRIVTFFDAEFANARLTGETWAAQAERIVDALPDKVYLSFDIDGLDPAYCPHTGTPVPGGLSFHQVTFLLKTVVAHKKKIVGFDLNEVAPGPDGDEWDANVAARLLYKMIGAALGTRVT